MADRVRVQARAICAMAQVRTDRLGHCVADLAGRDENAGTHGASDPRIPAVVSRGKGRDRAIRAIVGLQFSPGVDADGSPDFLGHPAPRRPTE
jgi:hypothetical protein